MKYKIIILLIGLVLVSGCYTSEDRLNDACNECGYEAFTDYTTNNNYNSWFNPITLRLVECDNDHIIKVYDGIYSTDKWGNKIIKEGDVVFCNNYDSIDLDVEEDYIKYKVIGKVSNMTNATLYMGGEVEE